MVVFLCYFFSDFCWLQSFEISWEIQFVTLSAGSCLGWSGGDQSAMRFRGSTAGKPNTVIVSAKLPGGGCKSEKKHACLPWRASPGAVSPAARPAVPLPVLGGVGEGLEPELGQGWGPHRPTLCRRGIAGEDRPCSAAKGRSFTSMAVLLPIARGARSGPYLSGGPA